MAIYRLYIDETGHHNYPKVPGSVSDRYLALTGIIIEKTDYDNQLRPGIESIRLIFYDDHDNRPPIHLTDIMAAKNAFSSMNLPEIKDTFNGKFMELISNTEFKIITVVIDKSAHQDKYVSPEHPYHYCLECLLERYIKFLKSKGTRGDVIAEVRGKKEDQKLKEEYKKFYDTGSYYVDSDTVQKYLTSKDIKLKCKSDFIQGLEFADLIALSSKIDVLHAYERISALDPNFTTEVIHQLQGKYYTGAMGIKGNGKKLI